MNELITVQDGRPVTTSRNIADMFGKNHQHVLRDIKSIVHSPDLDSEFSLSNFGERKFINERGREYTEYIMTKDGFTLVVMGYTGKEAMQFKIAYINAFNEMAETLQIGTLNLQPATQLPAVQSYDPFLERMDRLIGLMEQHYQPKIALELRPGLSEPPPTLKVKAYLTIKEMRSYLSMSEASVNRIVARKDFPAKIKQPSGSVLIDRVVLDEWLAHQTGPLTSRPDTSVKGPDYVMAALKEKKMLTKKEACFYIGISVQTLNRLMAKTDFYPVSRIGIGRGRVFINREKLDQWLNEQNGNGTLLN